MTNNMRPKPQSLGSVTKTGDDYVGKGPSCFVSYSTKDHLFAERLHADLRSRGVRCWFAPQDLPIGDRILDGVDIAIRSQDKVILVLSINSINSDWVEKEVTTAFEEEGNRRQTVLFPVRLDDEVMTTRKPWAAQLRSRNIGDFRAWRDDKTYKKTLTRVLRDLKFPADSVQTRKYEPLLDEIKLFPPYLPVSSTIAHQISAINRGLGRNRRSLSQPIVIVFGPPGYGKSYVISAWWRDFGKSKFRRAALYMDCSRAPGDKILRSISKYFCLKESEMLDDELARGIRQAGRSIIVLDGLSPEPEGDATLRTEADVEALRKVRELIRFAKDKDLNISFLMGVQTTHPNDTTSIYNIASGQHRVSFIEMKRFSNREGVVVFKELGVKGVSDSDLRTLTDKLMGLPIAIETAASILTTAANRGDEAARESLITLTSNFESEFKTFEQFLTRTLANLESSPDRREAHPFAFMRLLSLFNGHIHRSRIETVLEAGNVGRLTFAKINSLIHNTFGLVKADGDYLHIHPFVRSIITYELDTILCGTKTDPNVTLHEIQWIHVIAAHTFLSKIDPDPSRISDVDIEQIGGALHHLLALSALGPICETISDSDRVRWVFDKIGGRSHLNIVSYCVHDIVNKYLIDDIHKITLILGHYETRARLLNLFTAHLESFVEMGFIDKKNAQKIYSEMGICWMHSGRLRLANNSLTMALRFLQKYAPDTQYIDVLSSDVSQAEWVQFAHLATAQALIIMRQGRSRDTINSFFEKTVMLANVVLQSAEARFVDRKSLLTVAPALRAARKVITRSAQITLAAGAIEEAILKFERATFIDAKFHRGFLMGDAARRYIEALIRRRSTNPNSMEIAREVLRSNTNRRRG
jgi:hypothetical protein